MTACAVTICAFNGGEPKRVQTKILCFIENNTNILSGLNIFVSSVLMENVYFIKKYM